MVSKPQNFYSVTPKRELFLSTTTIVYGDNSVMSHCRLRHSFNRSLCKNIFQSKSHLRLSTSRQFCLNISYIFPSPTWRIFRAHNVMPMNTNRLFMAHIHITFCSANQYQPILWQEFWWCCRCTIINGPNDKIRKSV